MSRSNFQTPQKSNKLTSESKDTVNMNLESSTTRLKENDSVTVYQLDMQNVSALPEDSALKMNINIDLTVKSQNKVYSQGFTDNVDENSRCFGFLSFGKNRSKCQAVLKILILCCLIIAEAAYFLIFFISDDFHDQILSLNTSLSSFYPNDEIKNTKRQCDRTVVRNLNEYLDIPNIFPKVLSEISFAFLGGLIFLLILNRIMKGSRLIKKLWSLIEIMIVFFSTAVSVLIGLFLFARLNKLVDGTNDFLVLRDNECFITNVGLNVSIQVSDLKNKTADIMKCLLAEFGSSALIGILSIITSLGKNRPRK